MKYYRYSVDHGVYGGVVIAQNIEQAKDQIIDAYREDGHDITDEDIAVWNVEKDDETAELYKRHCVIECY